MEMILRRLSDLEDEIEKIRGILSEMRDLER